MTLTKIAAAAVLHAALLTAPVLAAQASPALDETAPAAGTAPAETAPAEMAPAEMADTAAPAATGSVARSRFTREVVDREPMDDVTRLGNDTDRVLFFTELHGFQGQELVHRWEFGGEVRAEVPFAVDGPRWRVFSSKALMPEWTGTWTVTVIDAAGREVATHSFDYVEAAQPAMAQESEPAQPAMAQESEPAQPAVAREAELAQPGPAAPAE